ncbi:MAG: helix-turn-helix transcriptional regulator [Candidatus Doudnabacteria bacterium]|nr:helix-turn-helix transcriptional regulator [Candidatus Doudnabacteria bacterium]
MRYVDFKAYSLDSDPDFRKEFEKIDLAFEISKMLIEARIFKNITQQELARLIKTKQPSIARAENGSTLPGLGFLEKVAKALGTYLIPPKFGFIEDVRKEIETTSISTRQNSVEFSNLPRQFLPASQSTTSFKVTAKQFSTNYEQ